MLKEKPLQIGFSWFNKIFNIYILSIVRDVAKVLDIIAHGIYNRDIP